MFMMLMVTIRQLGHACPGTGEAALFDTAVIGHCHDRAERQGSRRHDGEYLVLNHGFGPLSSRTNRSMPEAQTYYNKKTDYGRLFTFLIWA